MQQLEQLEPEITVSGVNTVLHTMGAAPMQEFGSPSTVLTNEAHLIKQPGFGLPSKQDARDIVKIV